VIHIFKKIKKIQGTSKNQNINGRAKSENIEQLNKFFTIVRAYNRLFWGQWKPFTCRFKIQI
jgi:hypothetical protein